MILIAGGTGRLGTTLIQLFTQQGRAVRVLTRDPERARHLAGDLVEIMPGDVRDTEAVARAVAGADTVISAVHGFTGKGNDNPRTVDWLGNQNLIRAARAAGVEHFVLLSIHGAAANHPMELFRMKYRAEQELLAAGLAWTIVRPTAYMETWAMLVGEPLLRTGKTRLFGRAANPINFVSVSDVARVVSAAVNDPALRGESVDIGGPRNLTLRQFAQTFLDVSGKAGTFSNVPLPMMRVMATLMRPLRPDLARQIQAGVVMDTHDMTFDPAESLRRFPALELTTLADVVRRDYLPAMPRASTTDLPQAGARHPAES